MTLEFSRHILEKPSWKSVQRQPNCSMWSDRHDEVNSRFSEFCKRA